MKKIFILFFTIFSSFLLYGCTNLNSLDSTPQPIHVGWIGPLSGDLADIGKGVQEAVLLSQSEFNKKTPDRKPKIKIFFEDTKCDGKLSTNAVQKLISQNKVIAIIGGGCSSETLAAGPIAQSHNVVMISPASTAPSISQLGNFIFRVVPSDSFRGKVAASFIFADLKKKHAAILYESSEYSNGIASAFSSTYQKFSGEITTQDSFLKEEKDFKTVLTKIKNSSAEVLFFSGYSDSALLLLRQAKEINLNIPIVGGDAFNDPLVIKNSLAEGVFFVTQRTAPINEKFQNSFLEFTNRESIPLFAAQGYDAANILFDKLQQTGPDPKKLQQALSTIKNYTGVSGEIGFDKNGDMVTSQYDIFVIKNGKPNLFLYKN